jgi:hypothetical protein
VYSGTLRHVALVRTDVVPSSILVSVMQEALSSSETSVLTRVTPRNIPEDAILHSHRCENIKSYTTLLSHRKALQPPGSGKNLVIGRRWLPASRETERLAIGRIVTELGPSLSSNPSLSIVECSVTVTVRMANPSRYSARLDNKRTGEAVTIQHLPGDIASCKFLSVL